MCFTECNSEFSFLVVVSYKKAHTTSFVGVIRAKRRLDGLEQPHEEMELTRGYLEGGCLYNSTRQATEAFPDSEKATVACMGMKLEHRP